jgi:transaldolase
MVKIPGTKAGVWVLEELAAQGIPTTPTVCVTAAQMIAVAEAHERGCERAKKAGLPEPRSTAAYVMGRLQDYLTNLNTERGKPVTTADLEDAVLALAKRICRIFHERGYRQTVMPAAFRSVGQVSGLAGADVEMTIHPKIQDAIIEADKAGKVAYEEGFERDINQEAVDKVSRAFPEFTAAYDPDALTPEGFDTYGGVTMTLDAFDKTGWQKLLAL